MYADPQPCGKLFFIDNTACFIQFVVSVFLPCWWAVYPWGSHWAGRTGSRRWWWGPPWTGSALSPGPGQSLRSEEMKAFCTQHWKFSIRAVDPDPHGSAFIFPPGSGSAFIFPPGSGSAFNMRIIVSKILDPKHLINLQLFTYDDIGTFGWKFLSRRMLADLISPCTSFLSLE